MGWVHHGLLALALVALPAHAGADRERPLLPTSPRLTDLLAQARDPHGVFAEAFRDDARDHLAALVAPTVYAIAERYDEPAQRLDVAMTLSWSNPTQVALTALKFRVLANDVLPGGVTIDGASVNGQPAFATLDGSVLTVSLLPSGVSPGARVTVTLDLTLRVPSVAHLDPIHGDGRFGVAAEGVVHLGHALPVVLPVSPDGTWDAPQIGEVGEHTGFEQSLFHVTVDAPIGWGVPASGTTVGLHEDGDRQVVTAVAVAREFAVTLLAEDEPLAADVDGTRVVVHGVPRNDQADLMRQAQEAFRWFSEHFGPLPFRELDIVEAPMRDIQGLEHCGLVVIGSAWAKGGLGPLGSAGYGELLGVVHELAHQWWYGHVGNDAQAEAWLDEGLTEYSTFAFGRRQRGDDSWRGHIPTTNGVDWSEVRLVGAAHPASQFDGGAYFDGAYGIGGLFLELSRQALGDDAFYAALRRYHEGNHCRIAHGQDLLDELLAGAPDPAAVQDLYDRLIVGDPAYTGTIEPEQLSLPSAPATIDAVSSQLAAHPLAFGADDAYKALHQACLGPAHAVEKAGARAWMTQEIATLSPLPPGAPPEPLVEALVPGGELVRVNLRPYLAGGGDPDRLADAFAETARTFEPTPDCMGSALLSVGILSQLGTPLAPSIPDFKRFLGDKYSAGWPPGEHSEAYVRAYAPAYRVVATDLVPSVPSAPPR